MVAGLGLHVTSEATVDLGGALGLHAVDAEFANGCVHTARGRFSAIPHSRASRSSP